MSVPAFKNSKSKVRRRRSHLALKKTDTTNCAKCEAPILPHRACKACGYYKNRKVISSASAEQVIDKKLSKKSKKEKEPEQTEEAESKK
ncbi:50S ribosomal protein L32 [Patescibacteria group bacterium]|nr:50S ribosomal protein L32 [Patescibacteria group bacterium]